MPDPSRMDPQEVFEVLRGIMVREFRIAEDEIRPDSTFEDLDLDSVDAVDMAVSVEDKLGFRFEAEDMAEIRTVGDVVDRIRGAGPS